MIYILLLRGINAGKLRAVKMEALRNVFILCGMQDVKTYIQTGNVVFYFDEIQDRESFIIGLQDVMEKELGWSVPLFIFSLSEWQNIGGENPFADFSLYNDTYINVALFKEKPNMKMIYFDFNNKNYYRRKNAIYFYCPDGYMNAEFTNNDIEKKMNVIATTRRLKTISYVELAKRSGNEKAFRAVVNANGENNFTIIVPCHRVINKNGSLGGYSAGITKKACLLEFEN